MPIYEYLCEDCGSKFEKLVRNGDAGACPTCGESHLKPQLSTFAATPMARAPPLRGKCLPVPAACAARPISAAETSAAIYTSKIRIAPSSDFSGSFPCAGEYSCAT